MRLNLLKTFFKKIFFKHQFLNVQYQSSFDESFLSNDFSCFELFKIYFSNYFSELLTLIIFRKHLLRFLLFLYFNYFNFQIENYFKYLSIHYCLSCLLLELTNHIYKSLKLNVKILILTLIRFQSNNHLPLNNQYLEFII